ncbi:4364_t:CDS:2 [Paraglomus brasilianum]|uniref:4364_t:CDS:1 n=1 Tax=Paraglomus brasilianum TaxID=144538 RepID=A0A9N9A3G8_9GLOM|nr:4364_t:CDS:2 [Paraglomus brasilianum]
MHRLQFPLRRFGTFLSHSPDTRESIATSLISIQDNGNKSNFVGATLDEIRERISAVVPGIKSFVGLQIYQFIYRKGVRSFYEMTSLSQSLREKLDEHFCMDYGVRKQDHFSKDGARKMLIGFRDPKAVIETVLIPMGENHHTLCVSSQIGCSLNCRFCRTGTQKLTRHLLAEEIVGQYMINAAAVDEFPIENLKTRRVSNIVFMGQGEPLYNYKNVSKAVKILTDPQGIGMPKHKVTISTAGVVPLIKRVGEELGVSLAISLHAVNDDVRDMIVPLNKTFPISMLLDTCRKYSKSMNNRTRRITFEYCLLKGVNDSLDDAQELARLLKDISAHVNVIPFNEWPGSGYETPDKETIEQFANTIIENGIHATVRTPRGLDILAACGQLKSSHMNKANAPPNS